MEKRILNLSLWNWIVIFFKGKFGGGLPSVFEYVADILNEKLISKVKPEDMKKYSGIVIALAECGEKVLNLYIIDETKRNALSKTVETLRILATALEDGKVTTDEIEMAVADIIETINAWKTISNIKAKGTPSDIVETYVPGDEK